MQRVSFRSLAVLTVVALISGGSLLAQDPARGATLGKKRYWADAAAGAIRRSNFDGSFAEDVVTGLNAPYGASVDPIAGIVLWTNSGDETVQQWSPGTGQVVTLQSAFEEPYAIVIDEGSRKIAYAVVEGDVVKVIQEDLSESESLEVLVPGDPQPMPTIMLRSDPERMPPPEDTDAVEEVPLLHGLALGLASDDVSGVLYIADGYGMMARRVRLADHQVDALVFDNGSVAATLPGAAR